MSQNKPASEPVSGLQTVAGKNLPGEVNKKAAGDFVDMQELLPVMSSFHEHLADEQRKNRARLRGMFALFAVLFAVFLIVPIYMGRIFLEQARAGLSAQKEAQELLAGHISESMESLAQAARELREELARQRELREIVPAPAQVSVEPPVVLDTIIEPRGEKPTEEKPAERIPVSKKKSKIEAPTTIVAPAPEPVAEVVRPVVQPEPATAVASDAPKTAPARADLEVLLRQVEQAISDKEKELNTRK